MRMSELVFRTPQLQFNCCSFALSQCHFTTMYFLRQRCQCRYAIASLHPFFLLTTCRFLSMFVSLYYPPISVSLARSTCLPPSLYPHHNLTLANRTLYASAFLYIVIAFCTAFKGQDRNSDFILVWSNWISFQCNGNNRKKISSVNCFESMRKWEMMELKSMEKNEEENKYEEQKEMWSRSKWNYAVLKNSVVFFCFSECILVWTVSVCMYAYAYVSLE